jgi:hypothetical protein
MNDDAAARLATMNDEEGGQYFGLMDHRSTSSAHEDELSDNDNGKSFAQAHIAKYIDFDSPILKHLIDIENKFWSSKVNQGYRLPKVLKSVDSESSIQSMAGITSYNLAIQNKKRSESARMQITAFSETRTASNFFKTDAKSCDSKATKYANKDSSYDNEVNRFLSSNISDKKPAKISTDKLQSRGSTRLKIKEICREVLERDLKFENKTPTTKITNERVQKLLVKKSFLNSKANSPRRNQSNPKECSRKQTLKDSTRKGLRRREGAVIGRLETFERSKNSYLRLETSDIDPNKNFLKKFQHIFAKTPATSLSKEKRERNLKKTEDTGKKSRVETMSNSKMVSKLSLVHATQPKAPRVKVSSREILGKISSEFLSKQRRALQKGKLEGEHPGSGGHSQLLTSNFVHSHLMQTPKDTKGGMAGYFKTRNNLLTFSQVKPTSSKNKKTKKPSSRDVSNSRNSKKRQKPSILGASRLHMQTLGHLGTERQFKMTPSKQGLVDNLKLLNLEKKMITSELKNKIWSKLMAKRI